MLILISENTALYCSGTIQTRQTERFITHTEREERRASAMELRALRVFMKYHGHSTSFETLLPYVEQMFIFWFSSGVFGFSTFLGPPMPLGNLDEVYLQLSTNCVNRASNPETVIILTINSPE